LQNCLGYTLYALLIIIELVRILGLVIP
jgi:hypothetical protein